LNRADVDNELRNIVDDILMTIHGPFGTQQSYSDAIRASIARLGKRYSGSKKMSGQIVHGIVFANFSAHSRFNEILRKGQERCDGINNVYPMQLVIRAMNAADEIDNRECRS
jgi:hypothetical protein